MRFVLVRARANRPLQTYLSILHWRISIFHWGFFNSPLRIFQFSIEGFFDTPVPLLRRGGPYPSTQALRPYHRGEGCSWLRYSFARVLVSPAEPLPLRGWRWFLTQQSCDCFTPNRRFLCGVTPPPCWASALQQALIKAVYTAQKIATLLRKKIKARALTPRLP